ncbi:MAG TPA: cytochrome c oxidase subunit 3 [Phnomibacter sp.]|nr:cytochrome c oxidase subunit 3 [Phnomibacter sp.]
MMTMASQNKKIHPHKFTLWVALGSIVMMFAGLTSAYIVKRNQANWQGFELPQIFTYSTVVIILSSITIYLALRSFKQRRLTAYRQLMIVTIVLGLAFIAMQWAGFRELHYKGIKLIGPGSNVSASFLAVIAGIHLLHVLGGVVALLVMVYKAFLDRTKSYNAVPVEIAAQYWHFVDFLWIYLFVFLMMVS